MKAYGTERKAELRAMYDRGMTRREIATESGLTYSQIAAMSRRDEWPRRERAPRVARRIKYPGATPWTDKQIAHLEGCVAKERKKGRVPSTPVLSRKLKKTLAEIREELKKRGCVLELDWTAEEELILHRNYDACSRLLQRLLPRRKLRSIRRKLGEMGYTREKRRRGYISMNEGAKKYGYSRLTFIQILEFEGVQMTAFAVLPGGYTQKWAREDNVDKAVKRFMRKESAPEAAVRLNKSFSLVTLRLRENGYHCNYPKGKPVRHRHPPEVYNAIFGAA